MSGQHEHEFAKPEVKAESEEKQKSNIIPDEELDPSTFKTYPGNCHCGKFRFQITLPKLEKLHECNCSICFMNGLRGLIWFPVEGLRKFEILEGDEEEDLTSYRFGRCHLQHKFCRACGINVFARQGGLIGVNALALEPIPEIEAIPHFSRPGKQGAQYRLPFYEPSHGEPMKWTKNDEPLEEGKVEYQGHCHCGTIRYLLRWKPMQEWEVSDCNCSFCFKSGLNNIYVPRSVVSSSVPYKDNNPYKAYTEYTFVSPDGKPVFCKTCGTHVFVKGGPGSENLILNVRTIEDPEEPGQMLDHPRMRGRCKMMKFDGRSKDPQYEGHRHLVQDSTA